MAVAGFACIFIAAIWSLQGNTVLCRQLLNFVCYAATDCRGHVIPGDFSMGDCCSSDNGGLSFMESGVCEDCFTDEAFTSLGTEYYLAFPNNFEFPPLTSRANLRLKILSNESDPSNFKVVSQSNGDQNFMTTLEEPVEVRFKIDQKLRTILERNKGIQITSEKGVSIVAISEEITSADMFLVLPPVYLPDKYEYYAVSVERDGNETTHKSALVIVASEDNTSIVMSLAQNIDISTASDIIGNGIAGEPMSVTLNGRETLYVTSFEDLTGSRVVANKPITFISGHECGNLPVGSDYCDQMFEQIPPTSTWGTEFYTAPFKDRQSFDIFKCVASSNTTIITSVCGPSANSTTQVIDMSGGVVSFNVSSQQYCSFTSDKPVLLMQFSVASSTDNASADPLMMIVPPAEQYRNNYVIATFQPSIAERYFANIVVKSEFNRDSILLNGTSITETWTSIFCDDSQEPCAYGAQVTISTFENAYLLSQDALFGVTVYSFGPIIGQGYVAGLNQEPVALDRIYFEESVYEASEGDGVLEVILSRSSRSLHRSRTITIRTRELNIMEAAKVGIDFLPLEMEVIFAADEVSKSVQIKLTDDDVFPEANKTFEVYLLASPGVYISPTGYASAIILNDDSPLPVMNISFGVTRYLVLEGGGCVELTLMKSSGAVGAVSVNLTTLDGTAVAGIDYEPVNTMITFEKEVLEATIHIRLIDNQILQDMRTFSAVIEVTQGLIYPAQVENNTATIEIEDDDMLIIGVNPVTQEVLEGEEAMVSMEILSGSLEKDVSLILRTFHETAQSGEDYTPVNEVIVFSGSSSSEQVAIATHSDGLLEQAESFSIGVFHSEGENVLILPSQSSIWIIDNNRVVIGLEMTTLTVSESSGSIEVMVKVTSGEINTPVVVSLSTLSRTAVGGRDFENINSRELVFTQEIKEHTIPIAIYDNPTGETITKTFSVQLNLLSGVRTRLSPSAMTVTISEDESLPKMFCHFTKNCEEEGFVIPVSSVSTCCADIKGLSINFTVAGGTCQPCINIGFNQSEYTLQESEMNHTIPVDITGGRLPIDTIIQVEPQLASTGAGQEDFILHTPQLSVTSDSSRDRVLLTAIREDNTAEREEAFESFRLSLMDDSGVLPPNVVLGDTVIRIEDIFIFFDRFVHNIDEDMGFVTVIVSSNGAHLRPVNFRLGIQTMSSTADDGDYRIPTLNFTLQPGQDDVAINITVFDDAVVEGVEVLNLVIIDSSVEGAALDRERFYTQVRITSDDELTVGFAETSYTVREVEEQIEICVAIQPLTTIDIAFQVEFSTASGTAVHGEDLEDFATVFTFSVGEKMKCATVPIIRDADVNEEEEMFFVNLALLTEPERRIQLHPSSAVVVIVDVTVAIRFEQTSYVVLESIDDITLTLSASGTFEGLINLMLETTDMTASESLDYRLESPSNLSLPISDFPTEIFIAIINDCEHEDNETFLISLTSVGQDGVLITDGVAFVTILYNDRFYDPTDLILYPLVLGANSIRLPPDDDTISEAISSRGGFRVFGTIYSNLYVTSNGLITFGDAAMECCPIRFEDIQPGAAAFVAPYWIDNDPSVQGSVVYEVHERSSALLQRVSDFISRDQNVEFSGVWMLVVFWLDVPEFFFEHQTNTYRAILITDGTRSYAIFKYECGELDPRSVAGIGYYINSTLFKEHPLSNTNRSSLIACVNFPACPWTVVVYPLFGQCPELDDPTNGMVEWDTLAPRGVANYTCDPGFILVGDPTRICSSDGTWSGVPPVCEPLCPALPNPTNGMVTWNSLAGGGVATYSCDFGFVLVGDRTRICGSDGTWSGMAPTCAPLCPALPNPTNGVVMWDSLSPGSVATYTCDPGFSLVGEPTRICGSDGTWSGVTPTCEPLCPALPNPTNGMVTWNSLARGGVANYSCDFGFFLVGERTRICGSDGTWSGMAPTCAPLCPALPNPTNGVVMWDSLSPGSVATYTCDPGFSLVGEPTRICGSDGTWSGVTPTCEPLCPALPNPTNGMVTWNSLARGGVANYSCDFGFFLVGERTRICGSDGTWSGMAPTCAPLCPALPNPTNGVVMWDSLSPGGVAIYTCDPGFSLVGEPTRICGSDGTWSGVTPTCEPLCPSLPNPTNGVVMWDSLAPGGVATYTCDPGFSLVGEPTRICGSDGTWSGVPPTCEPLCPALPNPTNGMVTWNSLAGGGVATYSCDFGFFLVGDRTRSCGSDGTWSGMAPTCAPPCPALPNPTNGVVMWDSLSPGSVATYTCDPGFSLVGEPTRICGSDGTWSGVPLTCELVMCSQLRAPPNGNLEISGVTVGSTANYSCEGGFTLIGDVTRVCQNDGNWSGNIPECHAQAIRVQYEDTRYNVNEEEESVEICAVTRNQADRPFVVHANAGTGSAIAPDDFIKENFNLSFDSGDNRVCFTVTIINDDICEAPSENFFYDLEVVSGDSIEIPFPFTEVVIKDDMEPECAELRYISLGTNEVFLPMIDDDASGPITVPGGISLFEQLYSTLYVITNGVIFFDLPTRELLPTPFSMVESEYPLINPFIAPYWIDSDPSQGGFVSYEVFQENNEQLSEVNSFISQAESVEFSGSWMIVAQWDDVPVLGTNETRNTYQAVLVTNGSSTYATYTYMCGDLNSTTTDVRIGYYINNEKYEEHPLSQDEMAFTIACENKPRSPWSNVVYTL